MAALVNKLVKYRRPFVFSTLQNIEFIVYKRNITKISTIGHTKRDTNQNTKYIIPVTNRLSGSGNGGVTPGGYRERRVGD